MEKGTIFWMLMILWFIFGVGGPFFPDSPNRRWIVGASGVLLFVLLAILGWHDFGSAVK